MLSLMDKAFNTSVLPVLAYQAEALTRINKKAICHTTHDAKTFAWNTFKRQNMKRQDSAELETD